jgi:hypothetical protein
MEGDQMGCNCGGSGKWQPPAEAGEQTVVAATGPAAPGYFHQPEPKVWNGPQPAPVKPTA